MSATKRKAMTPSVRETATALLLRILQKQAEMTADLFDTFHCTYYESYRRARGKMLGTRARVQFEENWADLYLERQKFYKLLSALKSAGLVENEKGKQGTLWSLTTKGKSRLEPSPVLLTTSSSSTIVSYDIPEAHRAQRDWLRRTLQLLDFTLLHQSVWTGKGILTEAFLTELRERKLLDYVHIMTVNKAGTADLSP